MMLSSASPEIAALRDTFVRPFYLRFLRGNFTRLNGVDGGAFRQALTEAASIISSEQVEALLNEKEWRGRLCAAWFIGLGNRASFVPTIGDLLLASELVYAGQGYCVALGLVANEGSIRILRTYLETYLPINGRVYNQDWAVGALAHIVGCPTFRLSRSFALAERPASERSF